MGQLDTDFTNDTYETRELAWELSQNFADPDRIRFLMESGADLRHALRLANMTEKEVLGNKALRSLHLQKHLHAMH